MLNSSDHQLILFDGIIDSSAVAGPGSFQETISISGKEGSTMAYNFTGESEYSLQLIEAFRVSLDLHTHL